MITDFNFIIATMQYPFFKVIIATENHYDFAPLICAEMEASAKARGTGIAKRSPEYLKHKMSEGKAVIAFSQEGEWAGFCYIETWSHEQYVANSGLIVSPNFRKGGVARLIKQRIFELSRSKYPNAKIFGLTTGLAVMKINSELGYEPVTYSELTSDDAFWAGCQSCINYEILMSKERKNCLCTAMLYDPEEKKQIEEQTPTSSKSEKWQGFLNEKWQKMRERALRLFRSEVNTDTTDGFSPSSYEPA
jgi:hypothetical protein